MKASRYIYSIPK